MLDDTPSPPSASLPTAGGFPSARPVVARYLDARARGLTHEAALREAAALLWALRPSLSPRQAEGMAVGIVAVIAS